MSFEPVQAKPGLHRPASGAALIFLHPLGVTHVALPQTHALVHVSCCTSPTLGQLPDTVRVSPGLQGEPVGHAGASVASVVSGASWASVASDVTSFDVSRGASMPLSTIASDASVVESSAPAIGSSTRSNHEHAGRSAISGKMSLFTTHLRTTILHRSSRSSA